MGKNEVGEKELYEALRELWLDLNDTGDDRNPETGKEYMSARHARLTLKRYRTERGMAQ